VRAIDAQRPGDADRHFHRADEVFDVARECAQVRQGMRIRKLFAHCVRCAELIPAPRH
jgi:hypothetical protein